MEDRREYHQLGSMEELRHEKLRIKYEIDRKKRMLTDDFERVEEVFTGDYLLGVVTDRVSTLVSGMTAQVSSCIRDFSSGFNIVSNLFGVVAQNIHRFRSQQGGGVFEDDPCYYAPRPEEEQGGCDDFLDKDFVPNDAPEESESC